MENVATVVIESLVAQFKTDLDEEEFNCKLQTYVQMMIGFMSADGIIHKSRIADSHGMEIIDFEYGDTDKKRNLQATDLEESA